MVAKFMASLHRFIRRRLITPSVSLFRRNNSHANRAKLHNYLPLSHRFSTHHDTIVFQLETSLLKSSSCFPYFMVVAMEGGGFLRGLLLLLLYPLLCCLGEDVGIKLMAFVSFCGLKKDELRVGRAVLPKHFFEDVGMEAVEMVMLKRKRKVGVSSMPFVMVEGFLKEYLGVDVVVGREMKVVGGYYTGFMEDYVGFEELGLKEIYGCKEEEGGCGVLGFVGSSSKWTRSALFSKCTDVYLVSDVEKTIWHGVPKNKYPKPLVFHDGRLAFLPTPWATLVMFLWLPLSLLLAIFRAVVFLSLPYKCSIPILAFTGVTCRGVYASSVADASPGEHRVYVCNHRTLLDPLCVAAGLYKRVTAVTYSISRVSEILAPVKTVRLTRDRKEDKRRMESELQQADLVVCPEGTTCREPYLLRFSPLFAELTDHIIPVALEVKVTMFYGTTAGGFKCLDPLFFLMNPHPTYYVNFLESIEINSSKKKSSLEVANMVQSVLGERLGFECTNLTRKDKYLILAGNEGVVEENSSRKS